MNVTELLEAREAAATGRGRRLREAAGLSQVEMGRMASVRPSTVNRWEAHQRVPHGEEAVRWARALRELATHLGAPSMAPDRPAAGGAHRRALTP